MFAQYDIGDLDSILTMTTSTEDIADILPTSDAPVFAATAHPTVSVVNLKSPPFWFNDSQVWFQQVEPQLHMHRSTAQCTKFDYTIAFYSPEFATDVRDLIALPAESPSEFLQEQLIKRTTASEQRKIQKCFHSKDLGNCKPYTLASETSTVTGRACWF